MSWDLSPDSCDSIQQASSMNIEGLSHCLTKYRGDRELPGEVSQWGVAKKMYGEDTTLTAELTAATILSSMIFNAKTHPLTWQEAIIANSMDDLWVVSVKGVKINNLPEDGSVSSGL